MGDIGLCGHWRGKIQGRKLNKIIKSSKRMENYEGDAGISRKC